MSEATPERQTRNREQGLSERFDCEYIRKGFATTFDESRDVLADVGVEEAGALKNRRRAETTGILVRGQICLR